VRVGHCVHSGKLRAEQTARLLVSEIGAEASVEARPGLAPNDPAAPTAQWLRRVSEHHALALVGHLPSLDRLASLLVADNEDAQVVHFRIGGLVKPEPKENRDGFAVVWAIPPDLTTTHRKPARDGQTGATRPKNPCQRTSVEHARS
jgi:phosphohistidine phosphatase